MARTWLFQCNPERFDIDGYLKQSSGQLSWLVARYKNEMEQGDTVYLWRSGEEAGIVGEAEIAGPVQNRPDDPEALPFWLGGDEGGQPADRIRLKLRRVAGAKTFIRRKWLVGDHALRDLSIIKMPVGTNYPVAPELAPRLYAIWSNTGLNWRYAEVVAAMWAYAQVWNKPVSRLKDSPVDQVSMLINRVQDGVYNKLMNLRALDPRHPSAGLGSGSNMDKRVWAEFYDPMSAKIREDLLAQRFGELWPAGTTGSQALPDEQAEREALETEVARLEKVLGEKSLAEWTALYENQSKKAHPRRRATRTSIFERNPIVVLITNLRASRVCEVPNCSVPSFLGADNRPYVETHHLVPLADGGEDTIENTACLCALHHREIHCGKNRLQLTASLKAIRASDA